jgi:hypothetical protein
MFIFDVYKNSQIFSNLIFKGKHQLLLKAIIINFLFAPFEFLLNYV